MGICVSPGFTRMVSSLWSMTILNLYIRVQVNILGRHLYINTARDLGSSQLPVRTMFLIIRIIVRNKYYSLVKLISLCVNGYTIFSCMCSLELITLFMGSFRLNNIIMGAPNLSI